MSQPVLLTIVSASPTHIADLLLTCESACPLVLLFTNEPLLVLLFKGESAGPLTLLVLLLTGESPTRTG